MKFKIGDIVRVNTTEQHYPNVKNGDIQKIVCIDKYLSKYGTNKENWFREDEIELTIKPQLSDLKERWIVKFRNGNEAVVDQNDNGIVTYKFIKNGKYEGISIYSDRIVNDIVAVYKPHYDIIWKAPKIEEMTLEQICKALGKNIKIKEEK